MPLPVPDTLGGRDTQRQQPAAGAASGTATADSTGDRFGHGFRIRPPVTGPGVGGGRGPNCCGALMASHHRPAVALAALRASAPARRPAVACGVHFPRSVSATSGRLDGLLGGCDALLREVTKAFSGSRVREPGTAERESAGRRPEGYRRMPGTRPSCSRRQTSPARPPVRDFSCSAGPVILVFCAAREGTHLCCGAFGAHGAVPGDRRSLIGSL